MVSFPWLPTESWLLHPYHCSFLISNYMLISLNKMMIVGERERRGGEEQGKSEDSGYGNCYFSVEKPQHADSQWRYSWRLRVWERQDRKPEASQHVHLWPNALLSTAQAWNSIAKKQSDKSGKENYPTPMSFKPWDLASQWLLFVGRDVRQRQIPGDTQRECQHPSWFLVSRILIMRCWVCLELSVIKMVLQGFWKFGSLAAGVKKGEHQHSKLVVFIFLLQFSEHCLFSPEKRKVTYLWRYLKIF